MAVFWLKSPSVHCVSSGTCECGCDCAYVGGFTKSLGIDTNERWETAILKVGSLLPRSWISGKRLIWICFVF